MTKSHVPYSSRYATGTEGEEDLEGDSECDLEGTGRLALFQRWRMGRYWLGICMRSVAMAVP
mgnify:CR=1 FL=1